MLSNFQIEGIMERVKKIYKYNWEGVEGEK